MIARATGRFSILRATESDPNEWSMDEHTDSVVASNIQGSVIERERTNFNAASSTEATIRTLVGRFPYGTDIQDNDRIRNDKTGETFRVTTVVRTTSLVNKADVKVELSHG